MRPGDQRFRRLAAERITTDVEQHLCEALAQGADQRFDERGRIAQLRSLLGVRNAANQASVRAVAAERLKDAGECPLPLGSTSRLCGRELEQRAPGAPRLA